MHPEAKTRVAVYIDWQNVYKAARTAFRLWDMPNEYGNFSPYALAQLLAAGNGRGADAKLVRVQVHRGLPSSSKDSTGYGANRRQSAAWMSENPEVVIPKLRPLRYPRNWPDEPAMEKGVDVQLAVDAVEHAVTNRCDIAIIFSHDTDLLPAVESLVRLRGAESVETASWSSDTHRGRLQPKVGVHKVFHHFVSKDVFDRVAQPVNYAHEQ